MSQVNTTKKSNLEKLVYLVLPYSPLLLAVAFAMFAPFISATILIIWVASFFFSKTALTNKKTGETEYVYDPKTSAYKAVIHAKGLAKESIHQGHKAVNYIQYKSDLSDIIYTACDTSRQAEVQKVVDQYLAKAISNATELAAQKEGYDKELQEARAKYL